MAATQQIRDVPYAPDDMFSLVSDIARYPEFLPWCAGARIRKREQEGECEILTADLIIAYKVFREQFTSRVLLDKRARIIDVRYVQGPFKYLANKWQLEALPNGGCRIHFYIDFEFRSRTLQKMMNGVFSKAFSRMMQAFIEQAEQRFDKVETSLTPSTKFEPDERNESAQCNKAKAPRITPGPA